MIIVSFLLRVFQVEIITNGIHEAKKLETEFQAKDFEEHNGAIYTLHEAICYNKERFDRYTRLVHRLFDTTASVAASEGILWTTFNPTEGQRVCLKLFASLPFTSNTFQGVSSAGRYY